MSTMGDIRDGIAAALNTIPKLRVESTVPEDPKPPIAVVMPPKITFDTSFGRGLDEYEVVVVVLVGGGSQRVMETAIMPFCDRDGDSSVKQALMNDRTLGGAARDSRVTEMRGITPQSVGENQYLAAEFVVTVYA